MILFSAAIKNVEKQSLRGSGVEELAVFGMKSDKLMENTNSARVKLEIFIISAIEQRF